MNPTEARNLIDAAGGDMAFARFLGIEEREGVAQRVNNWKRRGIPSSVVLEHYDAFQRLRSELPRAASKRRA
jgi:hypothetical protein